MKRILLITVLVALCMALNAQPMMKMGDNYPTFHSLFQPAGPRIYEGELLVQGNRQYLKTELGVYLLQLPPLEGLIVGDGFTGPIKASVSGYLYDWSLVVETMRVDNVLVYSKMVFPMWKF